MGYVRTERGTVTTSVFIAVHVLKVYFHFPSQIITPTLYLLRFHWHSKTLRKKKCVCLFFFEIHIYLCVWSIRPMLQLSPRVSAPSHRTLPLSRFSLLPEQSNLSCSKPPHSIGALSCRGVAGVHLSGSLRLPAIKAAARCRLGKSKWCASSTSPLSADNGSVLQFRNLKSQPFYPPSFCSASRMDPSDSDWSVAARWIAFIHTRSSAVRWWT